MIMDDIAHDMMITLSYDALYYLVRYSTCTMHPLLYHNIPGKLRRQSPVDYTPCTVIHRLANICAIVLYYCITFVSPILVGQYLLSLTINHY